MQVELTAEMEAFVNGLVQRGLFYSPEEAVDHAFDLLRDQMDLSEIKRARLKVMLQEAADESARGECVPLDMDAILAQALARAEAKRKEKQEVNGCRV